jgi:signal recognition particle subunit SRP72
MEKIDIGKTYSEIEEAINLEDHEKVLQLAEKILKSSPKEGEALQCKLVSLINMGKNDDLISFLEKTCLQKDYPLEYSYALHEKKKYTESIAALNQFTKKEIQIETIELLAQNYYKMGDYMQSYLYYKEIVSSKLKSSEDLEEEKDLISNFLASYTLSGASDESFIKQLMKYLNTWESFYNYCLICLKEGRLNETLETLYRMKKDYPQEGDEFNEMKNLNLKMNILHSIIEGFDYVKFSNLIPDYEKILQTYNPQSDLTPYFYNNFLHVKKDREAIHEILRKLDNFIKSESLNIQEKSVITLNKIILLLRANRINEASELFKTLKINYDDPNHLMIYCYIAFKAEKTEKLEELLKNDKNFINRPEAHLILIQMILSSLTSKNIEQFHLKILNFVKQFFQFTLNFNFLNFFIGFYESRHLKDYLKEFIRNYKDPSLISKQMTNIEESKKALLILGRAFYYVGLYEESVNYFSFILENLDKYDLKVKLELINCLSHINPLKSEEFRRQTDETEVDLSNEHISSLMSEVFFKSRKGQSENRENNNKKKKKKKRLPKNFDPKKPLPDPERWLPKLQRKKYKNISKNKMAYQGAQADNTTTTSQFKR